jgi:uncharacterized membrane protein YhaH (DUF805 family)
VQAIVPLRLLEFDDFRSLLYFPGHDRTNFQGFDRSLDIKYYEEPLGETRKARSLYLWDVMMLLITSIFFFGMAQSIEINSIPAPTTFYYIMGLMLLFDCVVLFIDRYKTHIPTRLDHYWTWILINAALGAFCFYASSAVPNPHPDGPAIGLEWLVLLAAIVRSAIDYAVSTGFMFPHTEDPKPASPLGRAPANFKLRHYLRKLHLDGALRFW